MKLSIIIPVFNEKKTIKKTIDKLFDLRIEKVILEVIVVDDGSTDGTKELIKNISQKKKIKTIFHEKNKGKGTAVRTGLKQATGDYILVQDADLEYDPEDIIRLVNPILKKKAQVVYGSRFTGERRNMFFWHLVANKSLSLLMDILFNTTISDVEVGYKLIKKEILQSLDLRSNSFDFEVEVTAKILKKGFKIYEVPISYSGRDYTEGKKIGFRDGLVAFMKILYFRLLE